MKVKEVKRTVFFRDFKPLAWVTAFIFLVMAFLPTGDSIPGKATDKILHGAGFYLLVLFFSEGYGWRKKWIFFLFAAGWGLLMEGVQAAIPWRDASLSDLAVNAFGAFLALLTPRSIFDILVRLAASLFYVGKIPLAPATFASAVTLILYYISPFESSFLILVLPFLYIAGIWISSYCEDIWGPDAHAIVVDEVVGVLVTVLFHGKNPFVLGLGFLFFRFFDIRKPFYIRYAEKLPAGFGVMTDDLFAGILGNMALTLILVVDKLFF